MASCVIANQHFTDVICLYAYVGLLQVGLSRNGVRVSFPCDLHDESLSQNTGVRGLPMAKCSRSYVHLCLACDGETAPFMPKSLFVPCGRTKLATRQLFTARLIRSIVSYRKSYAAQSGRINAFLKQAHRCGFSKELFTVNEWNLVEKRLKRRCLLAILCTFFIFYFPQ